MKLFDRFAARTSTFVSRAPFFVFCVLLVAVWLPSYFVLGDINTWQLIINTITTVLTFLLVALLQNSQERFEQAVHAKLNALGMVQVELAKAVPLQRHSKALNAALVELEKCIGVEEELSA